MPIIFYQTQRQYCFKSKLGHISAPVQLESVKPIPDLRVTYIGLINQACPYCE